MDSLVDPPHPFTDRSFEGTADLQDLRRVIAEALDVTPVAEDALRRSVWTFVGAERNAGTSPGHLIMALTNLVEASNVSPIAARQVLMRRVILWGVEAYFGHLGGEVVGRDGTALGDAPMVVSNR